MMESKNNDMHGYFKVGPVTSEKKSHESKSDYLLEFILGIAGVVAVFGISGWWKDYFDQKKEKRKKKEEEAEAALDPENLAKQKDKEVKARISQALGLFNCQELHAEELVCNSEVNENGIEPVPLVGNLVKLGDRVVIASPPGVGKSIIVTQLGLCIAEGKVPEFFDSEASYLPISQPVHLFDGELDKDDILERYGKRSYSPSFKRYGNCKFRTIYYLLDQVWNMTKDTYSHQTLIFDNLSALMPTMTTEETRTFFDGLDLIQQHVSKRGYRLTIIIVTHTTKQSRDIPTLQDIAGSAHITRFAKSQLVLVKLPDEDSYALVTNKKRYSGCKDTYMMTISNEDYLHFEYKAMVSEGYISNLLKGKGIQDDETYNKYLEAVRLHEEEGLTWEDVADKMGVSRQTITNWRNKYESE